MATPYNGIIWPLRRLSNGDFDSGPYSRVVESDLRTVTQTRRYSSPHSRHERRMRPGFATELPNALIQESFDEQFIYPLVRFRIQECLVHLTKLGKLIVVSINLRTLNDGVNVTGVNVSIVYTILPSTQRLTYSFEIGTMTHDIGSEERA